MWLVQHLRSLAGTVAQIRQNPGTAIMTACVIGVALALPVGLYLTLANVKNVAARWGANPQISLFLAADTTLEQARVLKDRFTADERFTSVRLVERERALADFKASAGFGAIVDDLPENPLPHILVLDLAASAHTADGGAGLASELGAIPGVSDAQLDIAWVRRLQAIAQASDRVIAVLAVVLGFGVILIVGNTIRNGINSRRDEIEVAKLCGATDAFVRRPFLYTGTLQGLVGGAAACILVLCAVATLRGPIDRLAALYDSAFRLHALSFGEFAITLGIGAALGWSGAWLAVALYLREIDITRD